MPIRFVDRYKEGFQVIVEAVEGEYLLGGGSVSDGAVFENFFDALYVMNEMIEANEEAGRRVKVAKVVEFRGMVSCGVLVAK